MQGGKKRLKKYTKNCLSRSQPMSEDEVKRVGNVWTLSPFNRWRLYKYWLSNYIEAKQREIFGLQSQLRTQYQELNEMRSEQDLHVCRQADVVGMTTTGAAKYRDLVQHLGPRIVIVEEAAEILESHIVTSLSPDTQHVILIGDHQQLRPSPTVYTLAVKFGLDVSLFERMVRNDMECYRLGIQHRMRPEIAALLVPHIYKNLENHESVTKYENVKGICKNVFFVSHDISESSEYDSKSKVNEHEAQFLVQLCRYVLQQGYEPSQITVLTTYSGQLFQLKRLTQKMSLLKGVKFTVVDNYQGEENDIILMSFVRSNEDGAIGFLQVSNRVCVALSRAKMGLFCIGNFEMLAEKSDLWKEIVSTLKANQSFGPSLQLMCQNHPGVSSIVSCEEDFKSVPEGGCNRNCEYRLPCGHVCSLICHPYDAGHENVRCLKQCSKKCQFDHPCRKKCFEECGSCHHMVDKKMDLCGHVVKVKCHRRSEEILCKEPCEKILPCGHKCSNACFDTCTIVCRAPVVIKSKMCGHDIRSSCVDVNNEDFLLDNCKFPCQTELSCGHKCKGTCSSCRQARLHKLCNRPCKRILVCGHECKSPCSKSCPPCKRPCENRCSHSKCPKRCGEPCDPCREPCEWECEHSRCKKLCLEVCDRNPCSTPCQKPLPCGHPCIGLCGEPCLTECRICDKEVVEEIFFGSEDERDARFVRLEDCQHFFEVDGLTQWMREEIQEVQMKHCPKCKTVIRRNLRFGNVVKSRLMAIEKVKKQTFGDKERNLKLQKSLLRKVSEKGHSEEMRNFFQTLIKVLNSPKCRSIQEITVMENGFNIAVSLVDSTTAFGDGQFTSYPSFSDTSVEESLRKLSVFATKTKSWISDFLANEFLTASDQQLVEVTWEVHRLKLANQVKKDFAKFASMKSNVHFVSVINVLVNNAPFREKDVEVFKSSFTKLREIIGLAVINVSEHEKQSILKAMGLNRGHWYQCPNGHVYCITECGGAMQVGQCNECGEQIGGSSHHLLSSNRVATAMDGSRHAAWSDAMNMENYRF